jgi:DNA-binding LacI/PurR family transcriptional regulator
MILPEGPTQMTSPSNITLKDIAEAAGVSVAAVSKVLNNREGVGEATRARVLGIMDELGYRGRSGRMGQMEAVQLLTLEQYVANDAFYGDILAAITAASGSVGLDIGLTVHRNLADIAAAVRGGAVDGPVLLMGVDHPDIVEALCSRKLPAAIVNGMDRTMRLPSVSPDYHFGAWAATRHLIELGHSKILHVTHPYRESIRRRIDGFRNAMEEAGLGFAPEHHLLDLGTPANISLAAKDVVLARLQQGDLPTALFCMNDMVAIGAMQAVQSMGLSVPDDISIIGFDGLPLGGYATPQLSSVRSDRAALGRIGVALLAEKLATPTAATQRVTVGVELLKRKSTAALRNARGKVGA